eukprot:11919181-Alexandrium_andersonii.AAC.1
MEAHEEALSDREYEKSNWMNRPATMYLVVLNETVGKVLIAACKGGLLDKFARRGCGVEARFLSVKLQKHM